MNTKTTFNLGDDRLLAIFLGSALALLAVLVALEYTKTLWPLVNWFGFRGFAGMPFVLGWAYCMHRTPAWITPMPKWLGRVINVVWALIIGFLLLAMIVMMTVSSQMIWVLVG